MYFSSYVSICTSKLNENEDESKWAYEAGESYWYLYDIENEKILEGVGEIANFIRSEPNTARITEMDKEMLVST